MSHSTKFLHQLRSCSTNHQKKICSLRVSCICRQCEKDFGNIDDLNRHIRTHTTEEELDRCQSSDKIFASGHTLQLPIVRAHSEAKPYKCNFCPLAFSYYCHLLIHRIIHTEERPYKCEICDKEFQRKYFMERHIRMHTGEKTYKCTLCNKAFSGSAYLNNHVRSHTDEIANQNVAFMNAERYHEGTWVERFGVSTKGGNCYYDYMLPATEPMRDLSSGQSKNPDEHQFYVNQFIEIDGVDIFKVKPYGCGICEEIFEIEKEFVAHCYHHHDATQKETFIDLFEGHLSSCSCREENMSFSRLTSTSEQQ